MNPAEMIGNAFPSADPSIQSAGQPSMVERGKCLLDVSAVAQWLGVSKGWVRDHASGRRSPRLRAIKLGERKGKALWKFREEDVQQFLLGPSR